MSAKSSNQYRDTIQEPHLRKSAILTDMMYTFITSTSHLIASRHTDYMPISNSSIFDPTTAERQRREGEVRSIKHRAKDTTGTFQFKKKKTYSEPTEPSSSDWLVSSSDWSLRRSQGRMEEESAISRTGAMLGRRLPAPFSVGRASLPVSSGGSGCCRSMATVPGNHVGLYYHNCKAI